MNINIQDDGKSKGYGCDAQHEPARKSATEGACYIYIYIYIYIYMCVCVNIYIYTYIYMYIYT